MPMVKASISCYYSCHFRRIYGSIQPARSRNGICLAGAYAI